MNALIQDAHKLSKTLLKLADDKVEERRKDMSVSTHYPYVREAFPSRMIMPLQDALTCSLPSTSGLIKTHNPFPGSLVEIKGDLVCFFSAETELMKQESRIGSISCLHYSDLRNWYSKVVMGRNILSCVNLMMICERMLG